MQSESQASHQPVVRPELKVTPSFTPIMENQMEKKMENEMEAGIIQGLYYIMTLEFLLGLEYPGETSYSLAQNSTPESLNTEHPW